MAAVTVQLERSQFDLLREALEAMLNLLVEDWAADVPTVRDPWEGGGIASKVSGTGEVWAAIELARAVLSSSARWTVAGSQGRPHR